MGDIRGDQNSKGNELSGFVRSLSEPLSKYGWPSWLVYVMAVIGAIYLLNPTLGVLELIPDNLPIIGNIDESVAVMLVLVGIVEALEGKKVKKKKKGEKENKKVRHDEMDNNNDLREV